jgi:hypothetical protein
MQLNILQAKINSISELVRENSLNQKFSQDQYDKKFKLSSLKNKELLMPSRPLMASAKPEQSRIWLGLES